MYNGFVIQECMKNNKTYDGNTFKFGITVDSQYYIVKFANNGQVSTLYSEYVASNFIRSLGYPCQKVWLGFYKQEMVLIIYDFCNAHLKLHTFLSTQQSSVDTDLAVKQYTYTDVIDLIEKHTKMTDDAKQQAKTQFWCMFICDAILGNRDRHHGNWGYVVNERNVYTIAPIYDNGGSLFPNVSQNINQYNYQNATIEYTFLEQRSEKYPASLFQIETTTATGTKVRRTNYNEILSDLRVNKILAEETRKLKETCGFEGVFKRIVAVVNSTDLIARQYARFYVMIVCVRYLHLIERKSVKRSYDIVKGYINEK